MSRKKTYAIILAVLCVLLIVLGYIYWSAETQITTDMKIYYMDVGQGNAVLVEEEGEYMLIDGGDREFSSYVVRYLKNRGVRKLKYILLSHYDKDHLNGVVGVLNAFDCEEIIAPDYEADSKIYTSYKKAVKRKGYEVIYPEVGDTYTLGEAEFTVVCPKDYNYELENNNSIGIKLVHGDNSFLFCGDASIESEEDMLKAKVDVESDVLMVSHHGSRGSSSQAFLDKVDASVVIISCGVNNPFGHPTKTVLGRIKKSGAKLFRTDLQGTIIATSDGTDISWNKKSTLDFRSEHQINNDQDKIDAIQEDIASSKVKKYVLNIKSKKIHKPDCKAVNDIKEENKKPVKKSMKELKEKGYVPCGKCKP